MTTEATKGTAAMEEIALLCLVAAGEAAKAGRRTKAAIEGNPADDYDVVDTRERIVKAIYALQSALVATGWDPLTEPTDPWQHDAPNDSGWSFRWYDKDAVRHRIPVVKKSADEMLRVMEGNFADPVSFVDAWSTAFKAMFRMTNTFDVVNEEGESLFKKNRGIASPEEPSGD